MPEEEMGAESPENDGGCVSLYENEVIVAGRCLNAPKVVTTPKGHLRAAFRLRVIQAKRPTIVPIIAWDKAAEACAAAGKDEMLHIEGRLQSWEEKGKPFRLQVVVTVVKPLNAPASKQQELAGV